MHIANLYDSAGRTDKALEWLERAYETRDAGMPYVGAGGFSADLRKESRFREMLRTRAGDSSS